jgi:hypothetical protein
VYRFRVFNLLEQIRHFMSTCGRHAHFKGTILFCRNEFKNAYSSRHNNSNIQYDQRSTNARIRLREKKTTLARCVRECVAVCVPFVIDDVNQIPRYIIYTVVLLQSAMAYITEHTQLILCIYMCTI